MTSTDASGRVPYAEYVRMEARSEVRLEFVDGWVYPRSDVSPTHALLSARVAAALGTQLQGTASEPYGSTLKVHIADAHRSTYPDVAVICGEPATSKIDRNAVTNPSVLIEVLSPTTAADDRGDKWAAYQLLPSLVHYVLVSQDEKRIEVYSRDGEGWRYEDKRGRGAVKLERLSKPVSLSIEALYRGIALLDSRARRPRTNTGEP